MIPDHYPSKKIIIPYDKIRKFLLKPGTKHYNEFSELGYTPEDDVRLFKDIEKQFDMSNVTEPRVYEVTGEQGYTVYMYLGIKEKRLFRTGWKVIQDSNLLQFVSAFRVDERRGDENVR